MRLTFNKVMGNDRPILVYWNRCQDCEFTGVDLLNSPSWHFRIEDSDTLWLHDFNIHVDSWGELFGVFFKVLPWYAYNTDGVDVAASNVLIERMNITNHDDAVVVKRGESNYELSPCSENITVRDINVTFSTGMTVGGIPPNKKYSCVRNVTFSNVNMTHPYKGIYVKTTPSGNSEKQNLTTPGSGGEITNIHYENFNIHTPLWWGIYIGPQQMKEPDGKGPGCLLYPLKPCDCEPLISMNNVTLTNIHQYNTLLTPGIIRCDKTNPCTGMNWSNVTSDGWWNKSFMKIFRLGYISENIVGEVENVKPNPGFSSSLSELEDLTPL